MSNKDIEALRILMELGLYKDRELSDAENYLIKYSTDEDFRFREDVKKLTNNIDETE